jgi:hypothetical protein
MADRYGLAEDWRTSVRQDVSKVPVAELHSLLRHTLHTNPTSTTRWWQKHTARKSTLCCEGRPSCFRISGEAMKISCKDCDVKLWLRIETNQICVRWGIVISLLVQGDDNKSHESDVMLAAGRSSLPRVDWPHRWAFSVVNHDATVNSTVPRIR